MTAAVDTILDGLHGGRLVPVLGPQVLDDVTHAETGAKIPATSDELILAMNNGQPMAPRLMYEFPRAAMNVELKRGRAAVERFLERTYADPGWRESAVHAWLAALDLPYIVDLNRDTGLQKLYANRPHTLVVGCARIARGERYKLYRHDGSAYDAETDDAGVDPALPVLFKPLGTPWPAPSWIASDADHVDYITELMGGFAIPPFLKRRRAGLRYLVGGLRLNRDTARMLLADIAYGAAAPAGWALIPEANDKERRFCARLGFEVLAEDIRAIAARTETATA